MLTFDRAKRSVSVLGYDTDTQTSISWRL